MNVGDNGDKVIGLFLIMAWQWVQLAAIYVMIKSYYNKYVSGISEFRTFLPIFNNLGLFFDNWGCSEMTVSKFYNLLLSLVFLLSFFSYHVELLAFCYVSNTFTILINYIVMMQITKSKQKSSAGLPNRLSVASLHTLAQYPFDNLRYMNDFHQ